MGTDTSLITSEIKLRPFRRSDVPALVKYANNKNIWDNVRDRFPHPYTEESATDWINIANIYNPSSNLVIDLKGELIGAMGLTKKDDIYRKNAEVGYWVAEPYWGQGIGTEALKQFVDYTFQNFKFHKLYAGIMSTNIASARVLERVGFTLEAVLKESIYKNDHFIDEHIYSLFRRDFEGKLEEIDLK